ncbi:unnamed protein product, partial [Ectocarpus sp. 12 AP-2014]
MANTGGGGGGVKEKTHVTPNTNTVVLITLWGLLSKRRGSRGTDSVTLGLLEMLEEPRAEEQGRGHPGSMDKSGFGERQKQRDNLDALIRNGTLFKDKQREQQNVVIVKPGVKTRGSAALSPASYPTRSIGTTEQRLEANGSTTVYTALSRPFRRGPRAGLIGFARASPCVCCRHG